MEDYFKLLTFERNRIFIDIAYSGCGSGCFYCYVRTKNDPQILASIEVLSSLIDYLRNNCSLNRCIISFCPNTEPFKSDESAKRVLYVIESLVNNDCYFQISTKELIPDNFLHRLNALARNSHQIFINVSIPLINTIDAEPGAATLNKRIQNFINISKYPNLKCGLYIKPFSANAYTNVERYNAIINQAMPDYVCIGVSFDRALDTPCTTLYRQDEAMHVLNSQIDTILDFSSQLSIPRERIVYSSICAISRLSGIRCSLELWNYSSRICNGCNLEEISIESQKN